MFHKVVWQHMQELVGFLITTLLQIYQGIFQWKKFLFRLRFDRIMAMSLRPHFFGSPCIFNSTSNRVSLFAVFFWAHFKSSLALDNCNSDCYGMNRTNCIPASGDVSMTLHGNVDRPMRTYIFWCRYGVSHLYRRNKSKRLFSAPKTLQSSVQSSEILFLQFCWSR